MTTYEEGAREVERLRAELDSEAPLPQETKKTQKKEARVYRSPRTVEEIVREREILREAKRGRVREKRELRAEAIKKIRKELSSRGRDARDLISKGILRKEKVDKNFNKRVVKFASRFFGVPQPTKTPTRKASPLKKSFPKLKSTSSISSQNKQIFDELERVQNLTKNADLERARVLAERKRYQKMSSIFGANMWSKENLDRINFDILNTNDNIMNAENLFSPKENQISILKTGRKNILQSEDNILGTKNNLKFF